jgi:hypothetical protein
MMGSNNIHGRAFLIMHGDRTGLFRLDSEKDKDKKKSNTRAQRGKAEKAEEE